MTEQPRHITVFVDHILVGILVGILIWPMLVTPTSAAIAGPTIGPLRILTTGSVQKYAKLEVAFDITNTAATNMYFPYDKNPPAGIQPGAGISVNALLLPPGQANWAASKTLPCFYYQPVQDLGSGAEVTLAPTGKAEWRCRFTPETVGQWQYKIRATDAGGTTESAIHEFDCVDSNRKGFIRVSPTDSRFFEFSDGTPFVAPLINVEEGSPFNSVAEIRQNIQKMGQNGIRFVRWFPTGEGANYDVIPFGDSLSMSWRFGGSASVLDDVDTAAGKLFSFKPYYYSIQELPGLPGARYRLSFRAKITGEQVLRAEDQQRKRGCLFYEQHLPPVQRPQRHMHLQAGWLERLLGQLHELEQRLSHRREHARSLRQQRRAGSLQQRAEWKNQDPLDRASAR